MPLYQTWRFWALECSRWVVGNVLASAHAWGHLKDAVLCSHRGEACVPTLGERRPQTPRPPHRPLSRMAATSCPGQAPTACAPMTHHMHLHHLVVLLYRRPWTGPSSTPRHGRPWPQATRSCGALCSTTWKRWGEVLVRYGALNRRMGQVGHHTESRVLAVIDSMTRQGYIQCHLRGLDAETQLGACKNTIECLSCPQQLNTCTTPPLTGGQRWRCSGCP